MKRYISFILILLIILPIGLLSYSQPLDNPLPENTLLELSEEEKIILEELFLVLQDIMEMEEIEKGLSLSIDNLEVDIDKIQNNIEKETNIYKKNLEIMENVLKSYQRNGSTSFIELIISSNSLKVLLKRINAIRDISRNTENLLEQIDENKQKLIDEKKNLNSTLDLSKIRQRELKEALDKKFALKDDLERRLESLKEEQSKYEDYLGKLETSFQSIKPIFTDTINTFVDMIENGYLPEDVINISFSFPLIKGIINEDNLRDVLESYSFPTAFDLVFLNDKIELYIPDLNLYIYGDFEIMDSHTIQLKVEGGKYMGLLLEKKSIEELFKNGALIMNFAKILEKNKIKSVEIKEKRLELFITPVLF